MRIQEAFVIGNRAVGVNRGSDEIGSIGGEGGFLDR